MKFNLVVNNGYVDSVSIEVGVIESFLIVKSLTIALENEEVDEEERKAIKHMLEEIREQTAPE